MQRLRETRGRQCAVPHDRIYALLSLISEQEAKRLQPDYRKPYLELVLNVKDMVKNTNYSDEELFNDLCSNP